MCEYRLLPDDFIVEKSWESSSSSNQPTKRTIRQRLREGIHKKVEEVKAQREEKRAYKQWEKTPEGKKAALQSRRQELARLKTEAGIQQTKYKIASAKSKRVKEQLSTFGSFGGMGGSGVPMGKGNVLNPTDYSSMDNLLGLGSGGGMGSGKSKKSSQPTQSYKGMDDLFGMG